MAGLNEETRGLPGWVPGLPAGKRARSGSGFCLSSADPRGPRRALVAAPLLWAAAAPRKSGVSAGLATAARITGEGRTTPAGWALVQRI